MTSPLEQYDLPDIDSITEQATPLHKTETLASLRHELTAQKVPTRDVVTPSNAQFFPEEYELETETGLVKTQTIASVKGQAHGQGITQEKLQKAVERNRKQIEKQRQPGAWAKLKHVLGLGKTQKHE